jgi:hypothetical protein
VALLNQQPFQERPRIVWTTIHDGTTPLEKRGLVTSVIELKAKQLVQETLVRKAAPTRYCR